MGATDEAQRTFPTSSSPSSASTAIGLDSVSSLIRWESPADPGPDPYKAADALIDEVVLNRPGASKARGALRTIMATCHPRFVAEERNLLVQGGNYMPPRGASEVTRRSARSNVAWTKQ